MFVGWKKRFKGEKKKFQGEGIKFERRHFVQIVKGACGHRNPHNPDLEATNSKHGGLGL